MSDQQEAYGRHIVAVMNRVAASVQEPLFVCPHVADDLPRKRRTLQTMVCSMHPDAGVLCPPCAAAHEASHDKLSCVACGSAASTKPASTTWIAPSLGTERLVTSVEDDDYSVVLAEPTPIFELYPDVMLGLYDVMLCADCAPLVAGPDAAA